MNSRLLIPTLALALAATLPAITAAQVTGTTGSTTSAVGATTSSSGSLQGMASSSTGTTGSTGSTSPGFPNTGAGGTWPSTLIALLTSAAAAVGGTVYLRRFSR